MGLITTVEITDIQKIIGEVVGARIMDMAHSGNAKALAECGINKVGSERIKNSLPTHINFAIGKSIRFVINEDVFLQSLNAIKISNTDNQLLNKWIQDRASFEMCRYFFNTHTNRKHTEIRAYFDVGSLLEVDSVITQLLKDEFNKFIYTIQKERKFNATDLNSFATKHNCSVVKLWVVYRQYLSDGDNN